MTFSRPTCREYKNCEATFEEKRLAAETIHGELSKVLLSMWRGIPHGNNFYLRVPINIRAFNALFWPRPEDMDMRASQQAYAQERFPADFFPEHWDRGMHRYRCA